MAKTTVKVDKLRKSFGKLKVLKGVSFSVKSGEVLALLGPNGAGKTTTINILSTLMPGDSGTAVVAGYDVESEGASVRASIGLTGQFAAVDEYLSGRENIRLIGRLYHLGEEQINKRTEELIKTLDLVKAADRPARTYSGGMKRRLDLAMSLVADPPVLFLDEPTTGLDPRSRLSLWRMINQLADSGRTILLTTQYMDEADFLADDIVVIDHGKVIAHGTPAKLKAKAGADKIEITFKTFKDLKKAEEALDKAQVDEGNLSLSIPAKGGVDGLKKALDAMEDLGIKPDTASIRRPTLDDVFLALTGHGTEEEGSSNE